MPKKLRGALEDKEKANALALTGRLSSSGSVAALTMPDRDPLRGDLRFEKVVVSLAAKEMVKQVG
jgi:hypothetical protein